MKKKFKTKPFNKLRDAKLTQEEVKDIYKEVDEELEQDKPLELTLTPRDTITLTIEGDNNTVNISGGNISINGEEQ